MASNAARPVWIKQAEEAKLKQEQEKSAAAWEAFNSTFKDVNVAPAETPAEPGGAPPDSDSEEDEEQILANKPIGPVDPGKCTAAGTGVTGGAAGAAASFVIVAKDSYGRRILEGGAQIKVKVTLAAGASTGDDVQEAVVKDHGDGTYMVTYAVAKRGNYVVAVDCNGMPILNSPFPVFFSGGTAPVPLATPASLLPATFTNGIAQNPYLGGLSSMYAAGVPNMQVPLAPSAAAMAAAQAIMAARAYEAAQAREAASVSKDNKEDEEKQKDLLTRTLQVSNLSSMLNVEQLKTLFSFCGTVTDCKIDDSKQLAYVEYAKPEEAKAALALNNMGVGGRPLNVEMAKSLPSKKSANASNGLPVMMQQAVALQQFQFQQALLMQQAVASQQAALQAATAKTASETAAARAAEISRSLNITGTEPEEKEAPVKSSTTRSKQSRSPSPIRYRPRHRSKSLSRSPIRYRRNRRSRSRSRDRPRHGGDERGRTWYYRSAEDYYRSRTGHYRDREREFEHRIVHRSRPTRSKRRASSRSPKAKGNRSHSPRSRPENKNHSRSRSPRQRTEEKNHSRSRSRSPRRKAEDKNRKRSHSPRQKTEDKSRGRSHSPRQKMESKKRSHSHSPDQRVEDHSRSRSPKENIVESSAKGQLSHSKPFAKEEHDKRGREHMERTSFRRRDHSRSPSPKEYIEEVPEKVRLSFKKTIAKQEYEKRGSGIVERTSSRRREPLSPIAAKAEIVHDNHPRMVVSPKELSHRHEKTPDVNSMELKVPDERFEEVIPPAKAASNFVPNQLNMPFDDTAELPKVSEVDERAGVDVKERRHHEKKHRRDDDEMKERKKRRHKHRSRRSSSDSADAKKNDRDDGFGYRKSSKRRSRHSRSASVSNSGAN